MKIEKLEIKLKLTEPMLGTVPKNKEVYKQYIATKARDQEKSMAEAETIKETEERGWTGFHEDSKGLFIYDYMILGFLKAAAEAMKGQLGLKNVRSKIDRFVFVFPRRIHLLNGKGILKKPEGMIERPLRAKTMQGERVTLARSDYVSAGTHMSCSLDVLENDMGISKKIVAELFSYGKYKGLGQFRNGSYGRFEATMQ